MSSSDKAKLDGMSGSGGVTSVAGKTGAVTLSVSDVSGAAPNTNALFSGNTSFKGTVTFDANGDARGRTWPATDNSVSFATTAWVRSAMQDIASKAGLNWSWSDNSGYIKFPSWLGGFIIQGKKIRSAGYHSYPMAFPNGVLSVVGSTRVGAAYRFGVSHQSASQFRIEFLDSGSHAVEAHILAVGR